MIIIDETCEFLINSECNVYQAIQKLSHTEINRLKEFSYVKDETKLVLKVIHAVVGTIKNLSLAGNYSLIIENCRKKLGELGAIWDACSIISVMHGSILHTGIISIVKNLCAGEFGNC